ncbi:MAG: insulinase family protein [Thiotrichales bacterium]|nr:insulinase family protein [Thiotrichales bacterium]
MTYRQLFRFVLTLGLLLSIPKAWAELKIESWNTGQGSKVLFVHSPELPMVDIEVTFDAGSARDAGAQGLANFTAALIGSATQSQTEDQLADGFNRLGAQFSGSASRDSASFNLRTLSREEALTPAFDQFVSVLSQAKFEPDIVERERQRLILGIKQQSTQPQAVLNNQLWKSLYAKHPYSHPTSGSEKTIKALKLAQLEGFYQTYYTAQNAVIALVGNVSLEQAKVLAQRLSVALPQGKKPTALPIPKALNRAQSVLKDFPSSQTYYALAQLGVERGHPDYIPLFVGNHLLGGSGFGSFLMEEVREKRGLVYGVSSYFAPMKQPGPFVISLSTKNASAKEAEEVVQQTLNQFLQDFPEERLQAIKENLVGGFALRMDSNSKILGYLSLIGFYDLPLDYLQTFPKAVESVTKQQVLAAWQKQIQPNKMLSVMVGQPE